MVEQEKMCVYVGVGKSGGRNVYVCVWGGQE